MATAPPAQNGTFGTAVRKRGAAKRPHVSLGTRGAAEGAAGVMCPRRPWIGLDSDAAGMALRSAMGAQQHLLLSDRVASRDNHLTLTRLILSLMVIYSHTWSLGGFGVETIFWVGNDKYGNLAVNCFFVVSGLLIARSYATSRTLWRYVQSRFLRIFPGYWTSLAVSAFALVPLAIALSGGDLGSYFSTSEGGPAGYVLRNSLLKLGQYNIGDAFAQNPLPTIVNGAIWTLLYEVLCYVFVVVCGVLGLLRPHRLWLAGLAFLMVVNGVVHSGALPTLPQWLSSGLALLHFLAYFAAGMAAHLFADRLSLRPRNVLLAAALFVGVMLAPGRVGLIAYHVLAPPLLVVLLFGLAYGTKEMRWERGMPDLSYGLYIYGWTVQQCLVSLGVPGYGVFAFLGATVAVTCTLAAASYYLVERPCMNLKKSPARVAEQRA